MSDSSSSRQDWNMLGLIREEQEVQRGLVLERRLRDNLLGSIAIFGALLRVAFGSR
jgi:hypothetical protein